MTTAVILLSHGSRAVDARTVLEAYRMMLEKSCSYDFVATASLQFNQPDLPATVEEMIKKGAQRIVVAPLFLYQGRHVQDDIPEIVQREREKYPEVELVLASNIGADERVAQVIMDRIREVC
ncbi:Sirohydrochlorin ferrochelatase [Pelotomaculum schinkii]|uniref:Sirohydrochlorin ferrochelatase n=1 Tax=Pelotomaculum schinkii TaxID=78350 RepID=A0A4Y7RE19_9FIRM|nr:MULTISPECIES: CbiX/SirB N-terminal domain-containing protein [Pelotomaculum]TEB06952.1 Sirohydrochlorin ferrochelatase [Pelotomaculum schinkii]TEB16886.1 Sirohydrochlorin ferrochelatase [Pelotomaculum sp. FP]